LIHLPHTPVIRREIAMKLHDSFASDEFLRYAAECERMARFARPVQRKAPQVRNFAVLPLCFGIVASAVVLALS
jgi:hypothetical protein